MDGLRDQFIIFLFLFYFDCFFCFFIIFRFSLLLWLLLLYFLVILFLFFIIDFFDLHIANIAQHIFAGSMLQRSFWVIVRKAAQSLALRVTPVRTLFRCRIQRTKEVQFRDQLMPIEFGWKPIRLLILTVLE